MVKLYEGGVYLVGGQEIIEAGDRGRLERLAAEHHYNTDPSEARKGTIAYRILEAHSPPITFPGEAGAKCGHYSGVIYRLYGGNAAGYVNNLSHICVRMPWILLGSGI